MGKKKKNSTFNQELDFYKIDNKNNVAKFEDSYCRSSDLENKAHLYQENQSLSKYGIESAEQQTKSFSRNNNKRISHLESLNAPFTHGFCYGLQADNPDLYKSYELYDHNTMSDQLPDKRLSTATKLEIIQPRLRTTRWKIKYNGNDDRIDFSEFSVWERRWRNYRRNKRKLHLFCDNKICPNEFKYIDMDSPATNKLKEYILYIRNHLQRRDPMNITIISNGTLSVKITDSFWIEKIIKTWTTRKINNCEKDFLECERNSLRLVNEYGILISSLKFIYHKLLEGSYPDVYLIQQVLAFIKITNGSLPTSCGENIPTLCTLVSWINTWTLGLWSTHTEELQTLRKDITCIWWRRRRIAHVDRSPQRHIFRELMTDLKSVCINLHSLLCHLEEMRYQSLLDNWNYDDAYSSIYQTGTPTVTEILAGQIILESALCHILYSLSHTNRIFGMRELNQSIGIATEKYNLLQIQLNSINLFDIYQLICSNLRLCQHSQQFIDMDLTVSRLTQQQNISCSHWLLKLWSRFKDTIIYTYETHTYLLSRQYEAKEYQLSLLAVSLADSLPFCHSLIPTTNPPPICQTPTVPTTVPSTITQSSNSIPIINYPSATLPFIITSPIYYTLPPCTNKTHMKLAVPQTNCYYHHDNSALAAPIFGKLPFLFPLPPYRSFDNRTGIG